ncbi:hypothetical protein E6W39_19085 [Kitasatospora acidiphila]|uniref:Uncharacterized protein n=1 Tax=Kitasatospora acidiphila TaxID=2567942 RepID=A0A540W4V0_9ACTN|nr:hypothetical protein [Kitasatospora acidiphila]TQF03957.1 hypothetical protein E6W39_19085 [Kitasatospora acidiphila]
MALYKVVRTDEIQPGELIDAHVIAGGARLARMMVAHMNGVSKGATNIKAEKIDTAKIDAVISVYFDEREKEDPSK